MRRHSPKAFFLHILQRWLWTLQALSLLIYLCISFIIAAFRNWKHIPTKRGNCAIYAFCQEYNEGGHILISRSKYGWWYHIQWVPSMDARFIYDFNPVWKKRPLWYPPIVFRGKVSRQRNPGRKSLQ